MGLKDSLAFLSEFNEIHRNPKFRSKTELIDLADMTDIQPNYSKDRRHSLNITVGTQKPTKEAVRQRTSTVQISPTNHYDLDTISIKVFQKYLNKSDEDLINKNCARGRRSSEPVNMAVIKKHIRLLDLIKRKGRNLLSSSLAASGSDSLDLSGRNCPLKTQSLENLNNNKVVVIPAAEQSTSIKTTTTENNRNSRNVNIDGSLLIVKDSGTNLCKIPIHEDWEAERIAFGLEVQVKIGNSEDLKTKQHKTTTSKKTILSGI